MRVLFIVLLGVSVLICGCKFGKEPPAFVEEPEMDEQMQEIEADLEQDLQELEEIDRELVRIEREMDEDIPPGINEEHLPEEDFPQE